MAESTPSSSPERSGFRRTLLIGVAFIVAFIILLVIAILGWDYTNSNGFCSNVCHDVHPEEPQAFQDSYHASIKCVECHMGRLGTLSGVVLKSTHARHLPEMIFHNYERPLQSATLRPPTESCERCHYPPAFHGDRVREIDHYQPDEDNTLKRTFLILKTGGGQRQFGLGRGIHWHIENQVQYIATDDQKQDIRWVRTTLPDGRTVEYNDVLKPLTADQISKAAKRTMDCVDCHNRAGHPFPSPDVAVEQSLNANQLSADLPFIKRDMLALLSADYPNLDAAMQAAGGFSSQYQQAHPEVLPAQAAVVQKASEEAKALMAEVFFAKQGISWRSFPDNGQHKDFPGCFRCHDGKHLTADGKESIRLQCNICHQIPVIIGAGGRPPPMLVTTVQEPASHLETNWMRNHRFEASDQCSGCHGKIQFGTDNSNFCSNPACHGQAWPSVDLNAAFPHPIKLVGAHTKVWCNDCHKGVQKPAYVCANCHQPPADHFSGACDSCHTPDGFKQSAASIVDRSPKIPHGLQGRDNCLTCHDPAGKIEPAPADHVGRTKAQCGLCHKPAVTLAATSAATLAVTPTSTLAATPTVTPTSTLATTPTAMPTATPNVDRSSKIPNIPHELQGRDNCLTCHDPAGQIKPAPVDHVGRTIAQCGLCHKPAVTPVATPMVTPAATPNVDRSSKIPNIPHELQGRDNCLTCHDPAGQIEPAPVDHVGRTIAQCGLCHKPAGTS